MLLTLRYKHSELIGAVLLIFFVVLFVEFVRIQPRPEACSTPVLPNTGIALISQAACIPADAPR